MANQRVITPQEAYELFEENDKNYRKTVARTGIPYSTLYRNVKQYEAENDNYFVHTPQKQPQIIKAPKAGVKRFIFTSAQDGTSPHQPFLKNLEAYAEHLGAELIIAGFTYNKGLYADHDSANGEYHHLIKPYLCNERIEVAGRVALCCEMNILPTAVNPMSGMQSYTQEMWGIFPHVKVQLESVAMPKHIPAKQIMTTGAVTLENYVEKKAGQKAFFHHVFGAVLLEVTPTRVFARHLLGLDTDGSFQDLDIQVKGGKIKEGCRIDCIDIEPHTEKLSQEVAGVTIHNKDSIISTLNPKNICVHDTIDFRGRNHHNIEDCEHLYKMFREGGECIAGEISQAVNILKSLRAPGRNIFVLESNHDLALKRWLKTTKGHKDPPNKRTYHELSLKMLDAVDEERYFNAFEDACRMAGCPDDIKFLDEDAACEINDIHHAHGHLGPNGSRGSIQSHAQMGVKTTTGHTHKPSIKDGAYSGGPMEEDMGYNKGPSSWRIAFVIQHTNGKRQIITLDKGGWRA